MDSEEVNLELLCKTCLNGDDVIVGLNTSTSEGLKVSEMLFTLYPNILQETKPNVPSLLCLDCLSRLKSAFSYHQQVQSIDTQLREILENAYQTEEEKPPLLYEEESLKVEVVEVIEEPPVESEDFVMEDDFNMAEISEDELLNQLYLSCQKKPKDFTPPDGTKVVYVNNLKHFQCEECKLVFDRRDKATNHVKSLCTREAVDESELPALSDVKERKGEAAESKEELFCTECSREFTALTSFKLHMRRHEADLPFTCPCCDLSFVYKAMLTRHLRSHTGERKYECDVCKKRYATKAGMETHKRLHSGLLPFECDCGKRFNSKSNLTIHTRVHTGEKPYSCTHCAKAFSGSNDLAKHMKAKHLGDFMYKCSNVTCDEKFRTQTAMRRHLIVHSSEL